MSDHSALNKGRGDYKRLFDLAVLVLAHLLMLPLWILLWTTIPTLIFLGDRGPVFYRQLRAGKDGKSFTLLKFRTMILDADRKGPAWTTESDPRVTRVGRLLRRTALDELPELLSIWKGEMSLVGPRALEVEEQRSLEKRIPGFNERLSVSPGLTGIAQVYDRSDDAHDKLRYDLAYIEKMSPWLDIRLIVLSVWNTLGARWDQRRGKPPIAYSDSDEDPQPLDGSDGSARAVNSTEPGPERPTKTDPDNSA